METGIRRQVAATVAGALLTTATFGGAMAGDSAEVTVGVVPADDATLSVSIEAAAFPDVPYRTGDGAQESVGELTVTARDTRGVGSGWTVTIGGTGPFTSSAGGTATIGLDRLTLGPAAVSGVHGERVAGVSGRPVEAMSATAPQAVMVAQPKAGMGEFRGGIEATILIPDGTPPGRYGTTLTVSIVAGP